MVSRDPDELAAQLEAVEFPGDVDFLSELRSEARDTVDNQSKTLNDIVSKASKILRINLILIGVLVSVVSIAVQGGGESAQGFSTLRPFINGYVNSGSSHWFSRRRSPR